MPEMTPEEVKKDPKVTDFITPAFGPRNVIPAATSGWWSARAINAQGIVDLLGDGDPRRCPAHPNVITSSADGMHDGLCGRCEYESYLQDEEMGEIPSPQPVPQPAPAPLDDDLPF